MIIATPVNVFDVLRHLEVRDHDHPLPQPQLDAMDADELRLLHAHLHSPRRSSTERPDHGHNFPQ